MRSRMFIGAWFMGILIVGPVAPGNSGVAASHQWAIAYLAEPTLIGSTIVQGPVLFTHDDAKMARGGPCTTVYLFEPASGPAEAIASFHCIPTRRKAVEKFTIRTRPNTALGFGCVLTEYQFAGDTEAHSVPTAVNAD